MSDETTLLSCPFCGGEAEIKYSEWVDSDDPPNTHHVWSVGCAKRSTRNDFCLGRLCQNRGFKDRDEAIAAWNTRAELGSESVDYMLNTIGKLEEENERLRSSCGTLTAEQVREAAHGHYELCTVLDVEYETKMDALLCRLTNGKWSKSRAYDLDFMVSCVDEEYETLHAKELAELGSGTCEPNWVLQGKTQTQEFWRCECGNCGHEFGIETRESYPLKMTVGKVDVPNFCPSCGKRVAS